MNYQFDTKPNTSFTDNSEKFINKIIDSGYSVLIGKNNCGKSFLLKNITRKIGPKSSYIGPARYQNFHVLGNYTPNRDKTGQRWRQFNQQFDNQNQNVDNSPISLQQAIAGLNDSKREILTEIIELLLNTKIEIKHTVEDNSMSQKYISCNGHNISYTSSGFRLIATLLTCLLDTDYNVLLIDEPELGISPEAQGILADFLFNREHRKKYFSHIKTIIFATHSSIFLDRICLSNNYTLEKDGDIIDVKAINSQIEFNRIHFFLLGNRLESLYMPSLIIIVEGKCDYKYIERVLYSKYPENHFSIIQANGDSRISDIFNIAKSIFGEFQKSPYQNRIFAILDSIHGTGLPDKLKKMGIPSNNIVVWSKNGIEYYYPSSILVSIFGSEEDIQIKDDIIKLNGISYTKNELVEKIIPLIDKDTAFNNEFQSEFLDKINAIIA